MIKVLAPHELALVELWLPEVQQIGFWWKAPELVDLLKTHTFIADVTESGLIRGFVAVQNLGEALDLTVLAVDPHHQRQGVMRNLIHYLVAAHEEYGPEAKALWLEVHEGNLAARNFYEKMGFVQTGKRSNYYRDGGNALLFSRATHLPFTSD